MKKLLIAMMMLSSVCWAYQDTVTAAAYTKAEKEIIYKLDKIQKTLDDCPWMKPIPKDFFQNIDKEIKPLNGIGETE